MAPASQRVRRLRADVSGLNSGMGFMRLERTFDYPLLNSLLKLPSLFPFLGDDFSPSIDNAAVIENPAIWYVLARNRDKLLGFWMLIPQSTIVFDLHTVMPLDSQALIAMRELVGPDGWLWSNTPCLRVTTFVPASNAIAQRFGLRAGLKAFGRDPNSYFKNGKLEDRILLGTSKPQDL